MFKKGGQWFVSVAVELAQVIQPKPKTGKAVGIDLGFYELKRQLIYKANRWGKAVKSVDRFYPSTKTCHYCSHKVDELPLSVRMWQCPSCHTKHDRDINAGMNILANANNLLTA